MEIKITISDTGAGGSVSLQINGESVRPAIESSTGGQQVAAGAIGAIDAGRAPTAAGNTEPGAPAPFSSGSSSGNVTTSPEIWAGPSTAALPGTGVS